MKKTINLALQGGGAHGAYAWGVLDKLIEDGRIDVDGLSATSAGSMNAVVYAWGKHCGGQDRAREALHDFWQDISKAGSTFSPVKTLPGALGEWVQSASFGLFETFTRAFSPYEFNPANFNPLRNVLETHVDFERLHTCRSTQLFISATNVRTNRIKVFKNHDVTLDAVLASACLPMLFQAVEIEGEAYWDGGYVGNPALYPLIYDLDTPDILVVHINPIERESIPKSAEDIYNRINEISFNSSLMREFRAISFVKKIVENDWIKPEFRDQFQFNELYLHSIRADQALKDYSVASKFSPDWNFLCKLRDQGRESAEMWLDRHFDDLGQRSSIDLTTLK